MHPDPADRHQAQELASRYVEPAGASLQCAAQGLRYAGSDAVQHGQLLDVERHALAAAMDLVHQLRRGPGSAQRGEHAGHLGTTEPREIDAHGPREPDQVGEERPQQERTGDLVGPERAHEQHRCLAEAAREELEQRPARLVGPVHVLDEHDQRRHGSGTLDDSGDGLEELQLQVVGRLGGLQQIG